MDVFDAAERYRQEGRQLIILAGKDYGSGSSRDWAAKGPWMQVCKMIKELGANEVTGFSSMFFYFFANS